MENLQKHIEKAMAEQRGSIIVIGEDKWTDVPKELAGKVKKFLLENIQSKRRL